MAQIRRRRVRGPRGGTHEVYETRSRTGQRTGTYGTQTEAAARVIQQHAFGAANRVLHAVLADTRRGGERRSGIGRR